jgi:hypothetical protein
LRIRKLGRMAGEPVASTLTTCLRIHRSGKQ